MKKGEVTAFLSILFLLFLSLTATIIESASVQITKNKRRVDVERAVESVFAEYQKDLLEEYDVFALDSTYERGIFAEKNLLDRRTWFYCAGKGTYKVEKIQLLSDDFGRAFREQVITYMKQKSGIKMWRNLQEQQLNGKSREKEQEVYEEEGKEVTSSLEQSVGGGTTTSGERQSTRNFFRNKNKRHALDDCPEGDECIRKGGYIERIAVQTKTAKGRGTFKTLEEKSKTMSKLYFTSYLLEKFSAADKPDEKKKLSYELEYVIGGKESDRENLDIVVTKLVGMRFPANYGFLLSDSVKKAEAETMAAALAGVIALPALIGVIKQAILLAWAFGESIIDVRSLLEGGKVELIKNQENWKLQLSSLLEIGKEDIDVQKDERGLSYREYLRMLLFLQKEEECTMRSLDIVE